MAPSTPNVASHNVSNTGPDAALGALLLRLRRKLRNDERPAWLIDTAAARLISINTAGARFFNQDVKQNASIALDGTMPALSKLRKISRKHAKKKAKRKQRKTLLFWTPRGAQSVRCQVTVYRVNGRNICLVKLIKADTSDEARDKIQPRAAPRRDDAEILRAIARRIRSGTKNQPLVTSEHNQSLAEENLVEDGTITGRIVIKDASQAQTPRTNSVPSLNPTEFSPSQRAKLAHELRTPISAIIAASEIIKDECLGVLDNVHYRGYVRDIHQSARHALAVIEQGLNLTEEPSHDAESQNQHADLNQIVQQCVATIKHLATIQNISVQFLPAQRETYLNIDQTTIIQIVLNLLTNAVKFTPAGGQIEVRVSANVGQDICVEVQDTGCGMSAADIAHYLGSKEKNALQPRQGGGLGIGLALSRQLAHANGARLEIESQPGSGTTAKLIFPLRRLVAV